MSPPSTIVHQLDWALKELYREELRKMSAELYAQRFLVTAKALEEFQTLKEEGRKRAAENRTRILARLAATDFSALPDELLEQLDDVLPMP